jgi:hypothetical protein
VARPATGTETVQQVYAKYQQKTDRELPVIRLVPRPS